MLKATITTSDGLKEIDIEAGEGVETGTWFNLVHPEPSELRVVSEITEAPLDLLRAALDMEESSRIEVEDDHILIITNVPRVEEGALFAYDTIPLGIVISRDFITTVCLEENDVLSDFDAIHHHFFDTRKRTRFLFQILYRSAVLYLKDLRLMNRRTDEVEQDLRRSMKNKELFLLLDLQKALTYFTVALRSNRSVIERLVRLFSNASVHHLVKLAEEDEELLEDVRIEYDQAIEMVQVHSDVMGSTMDAMASVISNNLNIVMKFLASVTIVMAIPTMFASFFGMNVPIPWQNHPLGFVYAMIVAAILAIASIFLLWKKKMF
ncbi:magnesium transporter CorA family protein [Synergistaceae bacterium OttesenSCG-928-I11]|nr:magnesium transporter CorA family protein [Synergistaceae bacterium OttesenSCG-928-I11]